MERTSFTIRLPYNMTGTQQNQTWTHSMTGEQQAWVQAYLGASAHHGATAQKAGEWADECARRFRERFPDCAAHTIDNEAHIIQSLFNIHSILEIHTTLLQTIMPLLQDLQQAISDNAAATQTELTTVDSTIASLEAKIGNGISPADAAPLIASLKASTEALRNSTASLLATANVTAGQPTTGAPADGAPTTGGTSGGATLNSGTSGDGTQTQ